MTKRKQSTRSPQPEAEMVKIVRRGLRRQKADADTRPEAAGEIVYHQGDKYPLPPARELYDAACRYRMDTEEPLRELGQLLEALDLVAHGIAEVSGSDDAAPIFGMVDAMRASYGRLTAAMKATDAKVDALFERAKKGAGQ